MRGPRGKWSWYLTWPPSWRISRSWARDCWKKSTPRRQGCVSLVECCRGTEDRAMQYGPYSIHWRQSYAVWPIQYILKTELCSMAHTVYTEDRAMQYGPYSIHWRQSCAVWPIQYTLETELCSLQTHDTIMSLWHRNVMTSFWRHNDIMITSCARWAIQYILKIKLYSIAHTVYTEDRAVQYGPCSIYWR